MLTKPRKQTKPYEYLFAHNYWEKQQHAHWLHTEINLSRDIADYENKLTPDERKVVRTILQLFTEMETVVGEYWSTFIPRFFPVPEVCAMAYAFANMESVHAVAYSYLNDSLGLPDSDYSVFLGEPSMSEKIERIRSYLEAEEKDIESIALSLAVFSAFTEGVALFSSFAILLNFSKHGKLLGIGDLIGYSIRDESLHSEAGCRLFRELIKENPKVWTDDFKKKIYQAARDIVSLEEAYMDKVFEGVKGQQIEGVNLQDIKKYIRHRANVKLGDLGLKENWVGVDDHGFGWVDVVGGGTGHADFFGRRVSEYSKGLEVDPDDIF